MEKIISNIENLLCYHEYVVVPGLGGFVLQKQTARVSNTCIVAPRTSIAFNALMQHADGLLAIEIARNEGISYRDANEMIAQWVKQTKLQLEQKQGLTLGNIGQLSTDEKGQLLFAPSSEADFLPQNFGLRNITILQNTEKVPVQEPIRFSTNKMIKYAAAAVLVITMLLVSPQLNEGRRAEYADLLSLSFIQMPEVHVQAQACSATITDTAIVIVNDTLVSAVAQTQAPSFHVIVASLPTEKSAEDFCQSLAADSFNNANTISSGNNHRVAIASFCDKNEALEYMEKLRLSNARFETAWVYCEKTK